MIDGKSILITGGTGSFGQKFTETIFARAKPREVVIFSRDEFKQFEMAKKFSPAEYPIRFFIGDIRDKERLLRAFTNIDYVVHAAALKQVPALEANPFEAVKTNVLGAQNIVEAALDRNVNKVVAVSTDKAVNPVNLYGATKLAMEKIIIAANSYVRYRDISFSVVRYGNVVGSRGSVIPFFAELIRQGKRDLPITDKRMTRFWITLEQGVALVLKALEEAGGGEVFVPKIPSMKVVDLVKAMPGDCTHHTVGIRPGEKLHESLVGEDEGRNTFDRGGYYAVLPQFAMHHKPVRSSEAGQRVREGFCYASDTNNEWLTVDQLRQMSGEFITGI
ncbi:MAG: UDP-N-acetylglucosamine 4,6-dehydratase (inverting) [Verrucomicrobiota bacterium]|jgi:UDP-N-acetylglucosamine 4,6-dehydratase